MTVIPPALQPTARCQHCSEEASILSALGHEPDSTDLLEYYLEAAGQQWNRPCLLVGWIPPCDILSQEPLPHNKREKQILKRKS